MKKTTKLQACVDTVKYNREPVVNEKQHLVRYNSSVPIPAFEKACIFALACFPKTWHFFLSPKNEDSLASVLSGVLFNIPFWPPTGLCYAFICHQWDWNVAKLSLFWLLQIFTVPRLFIRLRVFWGSDSEVLGASPNCLGRGCSAVVTVMVDPQSEQIICLSSHFVVGQLNEHLNTVLLYVLLYSAHLH